MKVMEMFFDKQPHPPKQMKQFKPTVFHDFFNYYQHASDGQYGEEAETDISFSSKGKETPLEGDDLLKIIDENAVRNLISSIYPYTENNDEVMGALISNEMEFTQENVLNNGGEISYQYAFTELKEMYQLLGQILQANNMAEKQQAAGTLLQQLSEWANIQKQLDQTKLASLYDKLFTKDERQLFEQLMERFERQTFFANREMYATAVHGKTSRNSVIKWLEHALSQYKDDNHSEELFALQIVDRLEQFKTDINNDYSGMNSMNRAISAVTTLADNMEMTQMNMRTTMSKPKQFTIHLSSLDKVEQVSHELMEKVTTIWKESQVFRQPLGPLQLSIRITPTQLGNMNIHFTQIDGEMMVHILVSSQSTKEILDANLHQLKSVFSPHQVIIEHDEGLGDEEGTHDEESSNQQQNDSAFQEEQKDRQKHSDRNVADIDFDTLFQSLREEETI